MSEQKSKRLALSTLVLLISSVFVLLGAFLHLLNSIPPWVFVLLVAIGVALTWVQKYVSGKEQQRKQQRLVQEEREKTRAETDAKMLSVPGPQYTVANLSKRGQTMPATTESESEASQ